MSTSTVEQSLADPRPPASRTGSGVSITGWRCRVCAYPMAQRVTVCMNCRGDVVDDIFANEGEVWASTCLRVRVPGHEPPFSLAYLVLDGGPRVLVHTTGHQPLPTGSRARVVDVTIDGDLVAEAVADGSDSSTAIDADHENEQAAK